ncbi:hypothetical protein GKZ90_0006140 [Flavobacterium sp. MC2016-06]|jgi:hypothetical protein|uniref:hypothetical protein n=1 Tax=Flavobacterium sp. MC2016-06 TaxID=2676308 RepID=UPI0012BAA9C5|nr:hypothetical protein [Flavobacterium sp. MC2016-06]MBU3857718.1 hypothetical protein [Flavobacterium sp. MC2016-06]
MNVIKKIFLTFLGLLTQICFSQEITINKINQPYKNYFKNKISEIKQEYKDFPDISKQIVEDETYYFDKKIEIRNKILNSLNILKNKRIIIIDVVRDFNGRRNEASYFFYNNKVMIAEYTLIEEKKNGRTIINNIPYIKSSSEESLKSNSDDVIVLYNFFNKNNFDEIRGEIAFKQFVYFNVTVVIANKIAYYIVRSDSSGYRVTKL